MKLQRRRLEDPEVNLISLIDIMLLLVIFFMLSSTFVTEGRMQVQLPSANDQPQAGRANERIIVTVTQSGAYRVNERELANSSRETLQRAITEVAGTARDTRVVLRADGRATHQSVVTAMDVLGRMGFAQLDVATIPPSTAP